MNFTKVTDFLESLHKIGVPGADLGIYLKGKEVYRHQTGFSNLKSRTPVTADTLFPIYSMTKVITCVAALRLYEKGLFTLTDAVCDYMPEFKDMKIRYVRDNGVEYIEPAKGPIRIVDLFTMSSGLTYNRTGQLLKMGEKTGGNFTLKELTSALSKDPLYFEPGEHWHYGFSHDVLGCLIEVISGKPLGEYFYDNIFAPLGMNETFFRLPENMEQRFAICYTYDENSKKHTVTNPDLLPVRFDLDYKFECAGGGLISTVDDYAKFANAICAVCTDGYGNGTSGSVGGGIGDSARDYRILSKATVELMRTNHLDERRIHDFNNLGWYEGYGYGLGVRTLIDKAANGSNSSIGEFGWAGLAGTFALIDPALDLTYVYTQQLFPSKEDYIAPRLRNIIYGCL
ncbi:MAG: beta-lactamase family protein [Oscillospiraceae bacterium]|jgi:CubicO group peptidase (beta-lactamase class C family)|nr:beta-lactamase family protein [Oscillospiraceae bacterium]